MDPSSGAKRRKLSPSESGKWSPASSNTFEKSVEISEISIPDSSISRLPPDLLSAIINYVPVPKTQWPSLELMNRSFRDAVYLSWRSVKEFNLDKDVLSIRQSAKGARLSDFLPSILAKLQLRSPMVSSIIGFPLINRDSDEATARYRSEILQIICQFMNLKQIDFGALGLKSVELVEFLTSSASRDRLLEISSSADYQTTSLNWPAIFTTRENSDSESQSARLKLEKLFLKNGYRTVFLDPRIIDLIDPSSLTVLLLDKIAAPSDYLLSLITNCNQLQQLQFSFMAGCQCEDWPCVHLINSKRILKAITAMKNLESLKFGMINKSYSDDQHYLDIKGDLPIFIDRLGQRGRLVEFGLLNENYCSTWVINRIGQHLAGLKSLELFEQNCCRQTFVNMIGKMVTLEKLILSCVGSVRKAAVIKAVATNLKNLRSFHLRCPNEIDCLQVQVLTWLNCLEELTIDGASCHKIKWQSAFGHQLRSLELRNCREELVTTFLKQVPGLRRLVISGSFPLSDNVLRMIPTTCPRLREFYISSWGNTKGGAQAIVDGCPELEHLRC